MSAVGGISVHAVDVASGRPAAGLLVRVRRAGDQGGNSLAEGRCAASGALEHPITSGVGVATGLYVVEFEVARFYRERGEHLPTPAFLETVRYEFGIADAREHFHLPFKFTAWGYSLFRGGQ